MEHRSEEERQATNNSQELTSTLSELKQKGSALLIVGTIPDAKYVQACSRLLGDESAGPRRRLFITTDTDLPSVSDRFIAHPNQPSPDKARQIIWESQSRSAAASQTSIEPQIPSTRIHDGGLSQLGITISEEITELNETADGLDPAELRVCFNSLESLLSDYDQESVLQFLHILIGRLRSVQAMGHFHLPVNKDSERVKLLAELFDATIELRIAHTSLQQRWHLHDADLTSTWLPMAAPKSG